MNLTRLKLLEGAHGMFPVCHFGFFAGVNTYRKGIIFGTAAYILWGLSAIYWKQLKQVYPMQLLCHRIVWAQPIATAVLVVSGSAKTMWADFKWSTLPFYFVTATLLGVNLFVSIWATNAGFIVELSLGYFTSPLVSVLLGVLCLRGRLSCWQWVAVALAVSGILTITFVYGKLPWVALVLAFDFGFYALLQKKAPLQPVQGITIEMTLLSLPCIAYLVTQHIRGLSAFANLSLGYDLLMVGLGVLTITPQLLFSTAIKCIPMTVMGLLQFIGPTLNIITGAVIYQEPFETFKAIGFAQIWLGLVIYTWQLFQLNRQATQPSQAAAVESPRADCHPSTSFVQETSVV
ncbi:unnamed protein product [Aphanomyces euteiches]